MIPAAAALLVVLLQLWSAEAQVAVGSGPPPGCPDRCGDVKVPFPFGIRDGCFLAGFGLTCDTTRNPPRLMVGDGTLQVVNISLADYTVHAIDTAGAANVSYGLNNGTGTWGVVAGDGSASPYVVSDMFNELIVTGCNIQVTLVGGSSNIITGCSSYCPINDKWTGSVTSIPATGSSRCSGIGCCEMPIPIGRPSYGVQYKFLEETREVDKVPKAVRIAERGWFSGAVADRLLNESAANTAPGTPVPLVLEWAVASTPVILPGVPQFANTSCPAAGEARKSACLSTNSKCVNVTGNYRTGYVCLCDEGYAGNPYVAGAGGCQDIDECKLAGKCFGDCTNTPGSFLCQCPRGAHGNARIQDGCVKSNLGNYIILLIAIYPI